MATGTTLITAEEFMELCEEYDGLCELVRGEIQEMTRPSTEHGLVCGNLAYELGHWIRKGHPGFLVTNDAGVLTERDPDTVRGPDLYFVSEQRLPKQRGRRGWMEVPPDHCVEVLSPSDRWKDVLDKVTEYLTFGVPEVWVTDPDTQHLHFFRPDSEPLLLSGAAEVSSARLPGFCAPASRFFEGC